MIQTLTVFAAICGAWMTVCLIMEWLDVADGRR